MLTKNNLKILILVISLWIIIQTILLFHFGIETDGESIKYIREANSLINTGKLSSPNFWMYITQISLIYVAIKFQIGFWLVVAVQLVFNFFATLSIYRVSTMFSNRIVGLVVAAWFLLNLPFQQFNSFLQTDSLFYSFTIIFSCYLFQLKRLSIKEISIIILSLVIISFTRPTGIYFFAATFLYLYFRFLTGISLFYKIPILLIIITTFIFFINIAIGSGGELDFMLTARNEHIICGVATKAVAVPIAEIEKGNSLYGLFYYIIHNFAQFSRLAFERTVAFFGLIRTHYSSVHQVYLVLLFFPAYIFTMFSLKYWVKNDPYILLYIFVLIFLTWLTVVLSCDDWHNRFFLTISPYLYILAIPFIKKILPKKFAAQRGN